MNSLHHPAAVLLGYAIALGAFQQQPEGKAAEQKCSMEGRVVNSVSGEALRKVTLTLSPARAKGKTATAATNDNGRFVFRI
jgi:hypothetical protein